MKGKVSVTCDAWQASNVDGYFTVTGSWLEKHDGILTLHGSLLGFVRLNNAHLDRHLGQCLFKVLDCVGIARKVCINFLCV